jgi:HD-GYP domain-containing protein (c-di-GMP phosphodiesterase class II)
MDRGDEANYKNPAWTLPKLGRAGRVRLYVISLSALALGLMVVLAFYSGDFPALATPHRWSWPGLVVLVVVAIFSERYSIRVRPGLEVSASFLAFLLSGALIGPMAAFVTGVLSPVLLFKRKQPLRSLWFSTAAGIVAGLTGLFYWLTLNGIGDSTTKSAVIVAGVGLAAGVIFQLLNFIFAAPLSWLRRGINPVEAWHEAVQPFLPFHFFFLAISLGLIYIYRLYVVDHGGVSTIYSTLLIMLCLLPVLGLIYAFRAFAHERELSRHNAALALRNERLFLQAVKSQVTALDVKDNYTARHSAAVARWATDIAQAMALSKHEQNVTHLASLVHDVGKIGVPDEVLNFPGKVEGEAWGLIETHCQNGHKILKTIDQFDELAEVILYHHERYDGSGYPVGLVGDAIPLISRVICVADSYSAMVSDRPYRKALPTQVAQGELRKHAGRQFDPAVVDCFLGVLSGRDPAYQRGELADFDLEFSSDRFLRELPPEPVEREPGLEESPAKS